MSDLGKVWDYFHVNLDKKRKREQKKNAHLSIASELRTTAMKETTKTSTKTACHERDDCRTDLCHAGRDRRKDGSKRRDRWRPDRKLYPTQFSTFFFKSKWDNLIYKAKSYFDSIQEKKTRL